MYSIGGVAGARTPNNAECFPAQPDTLWENGFAQGGQNETCATYNLLKLDRQLFMYDQTAKYMDHYEQALYNHILASVAEDDAGNTYHVPLNPGAQKRFGNAEHERASPAATARRSRATPSCRTRSTSAAPTTRRSTSTCSCRRR